MSQTNCAYELDWSNSSSATLYSPIVGTDESLLYWGPQPAYPWGCSFGIEPFNDYYGHFSTNFSSFYTGLGPCQTLWTSSLLSRRNTEASAHVNFLFWQQKSERYCYNRVHIIVLDFPEVPHWFMTFVISADVVSCFEDLIWKKEEVHNDLIVRMWQVNLFARHFAWLRSLAVTDCWDA